MAQFGSASALGAEGRRFKSFYPDMEIYFELARMLITVALTAGIIWQAREIKSLNNISHLIDKDNLQLQNKNQEQQLQIKKLEDINSSLSLELKKSNQKIISMTKALAEFKNSFKVK